MSWPDPAVDDSSAFCLGLKTGDAAREITTIYKAVFGSDKKTVTHAVPYSMSRYGQNKSVVTYCLTQGSERTGFSPGVEVPCVDGKQTWTGYYFPGLLTDTSKVDFKTPEKMWKVPANLHVGCMGLAPSEVDFADSVPPMPYGEDVLAQNDFAYYRPSKVKSSILGRRKP